MGRKQQAFVSVPGVCQTCGADDLVRKYECKHVMCKACAKEGCSGGDCRLCKFDRRGPVVVTVLRGPWFDALCAMLKAHGTAVGPPTDSFSAVVQPARMLAMERAAAALEHAVLRGSPPPHPRFMDQQCAMLSSFVTNTLFVCRWGALTELKYGTMSRRLAHVMARLADTVHLKAAVSRAASAAWPDVFGVSLQQAFPAELSWVEFDAAEVVSDALCEWAAEEGHGEPGPHTPWHDGDAAGLGGLVFPVTRTPAPKRHGVEKDLVRRQPVDPPSGYVTVENCSEDGPRIAVTNFTCAECLAIFQGLMNAGFVFEGADHLCQSAQVAPGTWAHVSQHAAVGCLIATWARAQETHARKVPEFLDEYPQLRRPEVGELKGNTSLCLRAGASTVTAEGCVQAYTELPEQHVAARSEIG